MSKLSKLKKFNFKYLVQRSTNTMYYSLDEEKAAGTIHYVERT